MHGGTFLYIHIWHDVICAADVVGLAGSHNMCVQKTMWESQITTMSDLRVGLLHGTLWGVYTAAID